MPAYPTAEAASTFHTFLARLAEGAHAAIDVVPARHAGWMADGDADLLVLDDDEESGRQWVITVREVG